MVVTAAPTSVSTSTPPDLGEHQETAIDWAVDRDAGLIEYGTGTGKTAIIARTVEVLVVGGEVPIIVSVPNSLIEQTLEEFIKWLGIAWVNRHMVALDGNMRIEDRAQALRFGKQSVFLISHESMSFPPIRAAFAARRWGASFIDEASRFRNYTARTKALSTLGSRSASRYAFTGNLAPRAPTDVWFVMNYLKPGLFGTRNIQTFKTNYCVMGGFENRSAVALRPDKLKEFLALMNENRISCQLSDVRSDMPDRVLHVSRVNMPAVTRSAYKELQTQLKLEIERIDDSTFRSMIKTYAVRLLRLQEIGAGFARNVEGEVVGLPCSKTTAMIESLEDEPATPTVIWYWWTPEFNSIAASLTKHKIPFVSFKEKGAVAKFMAGEVNVLVVQVAQGGYGLNLTRATRMIYHSLPWSLDVYLQSQERNMRLTTTAKHLEIIHLINRDSVDEYVRHRLVAGAGISGQLTRSQALEMLK